MTDGIRRKVLCAIDLGETSEEALDRAFELASPDGSLDVLLVVAQPFLSIVAEPVAIAPSALDDEAHRLRDYVEARLNRRAASTAPIHVTVHVRAGAAAEEIVRFASDIEADFVVVSTHSRHGVKRIVLGSVAEAVVAFAPCPVLVARTKVTPPKIEPLCDACAARRAATNGEELWCARHAEHHVRGHRVAYVGNRFEGEPSLYAAPGT